MGQGLRMKIQFIILIIYNNVIIYLAAIDRCFIHPQGEINTLNIGGRVDCWWFDSQSLWSTMSKILPTAPGGVKCRGQISLYIG